MTRKLIWLFVVATSMVLCARTWAEDNIDVTIIFENDNIVQYKSNNKVRGSDPSGAAVKPETPSRPQQEATSAEGEKLVAVQPAAPPKDDVARPAVGGTGHGHAVAPEANVVDTSRHPLDRANYAYPVLVGVKSDSGSDDYYERSMTFNDARECRLELKDGETYRIYFKNKSPDSVCLRVFVDGLNTLSQEVNGEYRFAPCLPLNQARHYVVEGNGFVMIQGFFGERERLTDADKKQLNDLGQDLTKGQFYRPFVVSRSDDSLAVRKGHGDEVGTITIGVYRHGKKGEEALAVKSAGHTRGRNSRLGTSSGQTTSSNVEYADSDEVGDQIDVYRIFY